jgi:phosphonopyruvate decarboxylase
MLPAQSFYSSCIRQGVDFFTGVPDSLLQDFCAFVMDHVPTQLHVIAANEGGAVGLATGHYLATGKPALVYLQNSGLGNAANPLLSLADPEVYGIPMLLLVGWRGQPGVKDEPQHVKQGRVMAAMLGAMEIPCEVLEPDSGAVDAQIARLLTLARNQCRPVALIVKKGMFEKYPAKRAAINSYGLGREEAIWQIAAHVSPEAIVVGTTGHISRELYEYRSKHGAGPGQDFLTVGSMGHASQIALGIALAQPERQVFCLDGDGAALMHLGALPIIGQAHVHNFRHVVLNNGAHVSVGGQPTVAFSVSLVNIAEASGYAFAQSVDSAEKLGQALVAMDGVAGPAFLEVRVSLTARADLARPKSSPAENKAAFMKHLRTPIQSRP